MMLMVLDQMDWEDATQNMPSYHYVKLYPHYLPNLLTSLLNVTFCNYALTH